MIERVLYERHFDGCWTARITHKYASLLRSGGSTRNNRLSVWWCLMKDDSPTAVFEDDDLRMAFKIRDAAQKILDSLPLPVGANIEVDCLRKEVKELKAEVASLKRRKAKKSPTRRK